MIINITGGRDWSHVTELRDWLDKFHAKFPITKLIHGGARGADKICGQWALDNNIEVVEMKADWNKHGRAAGPLRNRDMLAYAREIGGSTLLAFPCVGSKGTFDMINICEKSGFKIYIVPEEKIA